MNKVLFITGMRSKKYGGVERFILNFIRTCNQSGMPVVLQYEELPESTQYLKDLDSLDVEIVILSIKNKNPLSALICMAEIIRKYRPEILHIQFLRNYYIFFFPKLGRLFGVQKVIAMVHSLPRKKADSSLLNRLRAVSYNSADVVIAVSDMVRQELEAIGVVRSKIILHHLGLFDIAYKSSDLRSELRRKFRISEDETVIASIVFDNPVKGADVLIKAFCELRKSRPDIKLFLIGIDHESQIVKQLPFHISECKGIVFSGISDNARQLLGLADVYVQPSLSDALPIAVIEAITMELPLLVTDACGVIRYLSQDKDVVIVQSGSVEGLKEGILNLLGMKPLWEDMTANCMKVFCELFDGQKTIKSFVRRNYLKKNIVLV